MLKYKYNCAFCITVTDIVIFIFIYSLVLHMLYSLRGFMQCDQWNVDQKNVVMHFLKQKSRFPETYLPMIILIMLYFDLSTISTSILAVKFFNFGIVSAQNRINGVNLKDRFMGFFCWFLFFGFFFLYFSFIISLIEHTTILFIERTYVDSF